MRQFRVRCLAVDRRCPRTPDGQPDLQGFWTNDNVTPLERPAEFGNKEVLTPEEAAAYAKKRRDQFLAQPADNIPLRRRRSGRTSITPRTRLPGYAPRS
jgi:hypothetical protein